MIYPGVGSVVWPILHWIGTISIFLAVAGYFLSSRRKINRLPTRLKFPTGLQPQKCTIKPSTDILITPLQSALSKLITFAIQSQISSIIPQLENVFGADPQVSKSILLSFLSLKMTDASEMVVDWINRIKTDQLHEKIIHGWINIIESHIKNYKDCRNELDAKVLRRNASVKKRHIDDFNDYAVDSTDDANQWSIGVDKVNSQIVNRMRAEGTLHEVAGRGQEMELSYLRDIANRLILVHDTMYAKSNHQKPYGTPSKILKVLVREWCICSIVWPIIDRLCRPDVINCALLETVTGTLTKANRRINVQKSIKSFRNTLDTAFKQFPPAFLFAPIYSTFFNLPLQSKLKLIELSSRCSRRMISVIDMTAIRHEITHEIKIIKDKQREMETDALQSDDNTKVQFDLRKTVTALEILHSKLVKRIQTINEESNMAKLNSKPFKIYSRRLSSQTLDELAQSNFSSLTADALTLGTVLESHFQSIAENGGIRSPSVFFFLEFLAKQTDNILCNAKLKFWLDAERYRYAPF